MPHLRSPRKRTRAGQLFASPGARQVNRRTPPDTWDAWKTAAQAATERTEGGRKELTIITGQESSVVHPLTALIWTNGASIRSVAYESATGGVRSLIVVTRRWSRSRKQSIPFQ